MAQHPPVLIELQNVFVRQIDAFAAVGTIHGTVTASEFVYVQNEGQLVYFVPNNGGPR